MELILVRHALPLRVQTADGSPADPPLSELGHRQAAAMADWLRGETIDAVHVSPLRRARDTAAPLEAVLGLAAIVTEGVSEFDSRSSAYVPMEELKATDYQRWKRFVRGEDTGLEDPVEFQLTVVATVEGIAAANPGRRVVVVCHGGVINGYAAHVVGRPAGDFLFFDPAYASISRFLAAGTGERSVMSLNERGHLRGLPTTGRTDGA